MPDENDTALGGLLRGLREQRRLSVKKFATLSGVSRKMIVNAESGSNVSVLVLKRMLRPLGVKTITLQLDGPANVELVEGLVGADVRAIADAVNKATALLQSVSRRIEQRSDGPAPDDDMSERAEHLIASFSAFVRSVDDVDDLERLQETVTTLSGGGRRAPRHRASSRRRRSG